MDADDGTEKDAEADTEDNQEEDTEVDAEDGTEEDAERNTEENREEDAENDAGVDAECGTEEDAKGDMEENQEECTWNTARKTWFGIFDESSATPIIIILCWTVRTKQKDRYEGLHGHVSFLENVDFADDVAILFHTRKDLQEVISMFINTSQ